MMINKLHRAADFAEQVKERRKGEVFAHFKHMGRDREADSSM